MDIYNYLNSKDVARHCRKLKWQFNAFEMAFIINECKTLPLCEKHSLYAEIMDTMPDISIPEDQKHILVDESFFSTLKQHIEKEKCILEKIKIGGNDKEYTYVYHDEYADINFESEEVYPDYLTAVKKMFEEIQDWSKNAPDIKIYGTVIMRTFRERSTCEALFDQNGNIISVSDYNEKPRALFEYFGIYVPVPFQKGEILITADRSQLNRHIMVLDNVWYLDCSKKKRACHKKSFHREDMFAYGYCVDENVRLYKEHIHDYYNLEYFTRDIKFNDRLLKTVSAFIKNEIDLEMLLTAYDALKNEKALTRGFLPSYDNKKCYRKAGIDDIYEKCKLIWDFERSNYGKDNIIY